MNSGSGDVGSSDDSDLVLSRDPASSFTGGTKNGSALVSDVAAIVQEFEGPKRRKKLQIRSQIDSQPPVDARDIQWEHFSSLALFQSCRRLNCLIDLLILFIYLVTLQQMKSNFWKIKVHATKSSLKLVGRTCIGIRHKGAELKFQLSWLCLQPATVSMEQLRFQR